MTQIEYAKELFWRVIDGDITAVIDLLKVSCLLVLTSFLAKPYAAFTGILACVVMYNRVLKTIAKRKEQESRTREQYNQEEITRIMLDGMKSKMKSEGLTGEEPNLKK